MESEKSIDSEMNSEGEEDIVKDQNMENGSKSEEGIDVGA
jgi:hypothetical protein